MAESNAFPVFTLEAVNELVPELERLFDQQDARRRRIEGMLDELTEELGGPPETLEKKMDDPPHVRTMKDRVLAAMADYDDQWKALKSMGGVLKDMRLGLVDFYGQVDGQLVWLCWKHGEKAISHYHALDEGFAARKQIKTSMKMRLLN